MIPVALCADDYALSPGIDEAILALADAGRVTAFSCMTASKRWSQAAVALKPLFPERLCQRVISLLIYGPGRFLHFRQL